MADIEYTRKFDGGGTGREFIQFSEDAVANPAKSEAAGRPIFDPVEMIEISFPGNNLTVVSRRVTPEDRIVYAPQYAAFKKHGGTVVDGTPLAAWTALSKAQVREFQAMHIFSIEQLAATDDHGCQRMGLGGAMWRQRAKLFIAAAEDTGAVDKVAAENYRLKERVDAQATQLAELGAMCQSLQHQVQATMSGRVDTGQGIANLPPIATAPAAISPEMAGGSLGQAQGEYVEPKRRGPGRPAKTEAAA